MQQISNLPVFTGTIPNKATQNDTDFANNIFGFLNYSGNSFVTDFNVIVGQFNTLSDEIQTAAQSATTNAGQAKTARDEAVGALATLTAGAIDNTNKANNKAYSNLKVDELLTNFEDTLGTAKVSAATTTIGTAGSGETLHITGSTTITSLGVSQTGVTRNVIFDGALTLTHNATSLILPTNANITTAAGDSAIFVCENGANGYWRCLSYSRLNGGLITPRTISGVSWNGTSNIEIEDRLGTAKASAATTTIGTAGFGDYFHITGTTTITSFGTATTAGIRRTLIFDGALTLTHHATNLICPGAANIVTVEGTVIEVIAETTTTWRVVSITHPSTSFTDMGSIKGKAPLVNPNFTNPSGTTQSAGDNSTKLATTEYVDRKFARGTAVATTSGAAIDFTGIPAWAKRITFMFNGVSTSGVSELVIRIGSGSFIATGYLGATGDLNGANSSGQTAYNTGFSTGRRVGGASEVLYGNVVLTNHSANIWNCSVGLGSAYVAYSGGGALALSGTLDRIRLTIVNGTDQFDGGSVNIMYEG